MALTESFVVHAFCDNEFERDGRKRGCTEAAKVVFDEAVADHQQEARKQLAEKGWKFFDDGSCLCPTCEEMGVPTE